MVSGLRLIFNVEWNASLRAWDAGRSGAKGAKTQILGSVWCRQGSGKVPYWGNLCLDSLRYQCATTGIYFLSLVTICEQEATKYTV